MKEFKEIYRQAFVATFLKFVLLDWFSYKYLSIATF